MKNCRLCGRMFYSSGKRYLCQSCRDEVLAINKTIKYINYIKENAEEISLKETAPRYFQLENNYRRKLGLSECKDIDNCLQCKRNDCILKE